jgi:hypothetical protein
VKWYVDSTSLARYIRYAIEQYRLLGAEAPPAPTLVREPAAAAPAPAAAPAAAPTALAVPSGDGAGRVPDGAPGETSGDGEPRNTPEGDAVATALEAALDVANRTAALAEHLAGGLRVALDLLRDDGSVARREVVDVLALAQQAADRARARALHLGIPLRVSADRKKVLATADRGALCQALDRLFALVLATGCASGARVAVAARGRQVRVEADWELRKGARLAEPDDPLVALDLALCRRLAPRAGGAFAADASASEATATLTLDAPAHG